MPTTASAVPTFRDHLATLAGRRVYFGHKSVGDDILTGVGQLLATSPAAQLRVVDSSTPETLAEPGLAHSEVGVNFDPESKIRDFERIVRGGIGDRADIALFKFCFVDVKRDTNLTALFDAYRRTMVDLVTAYPRTTFVHSTIPLQGRRRDWKGRVKWLLGRLKPFAEDNATRNRFNELFRREYGSSGKLFDLAAAESTHEDGRPCTINSAEGLAPCLCPEYTLDGGHLNPHGQRVVAEQFLAFLASVPRA